MAGRKKTVAQGEVSISDSALNTEMDKLCAVIAKATTVKAETAFTKHFDAVSTGSFVVDQLIGGALSSDGQPYCMGFPRCRITEVAGAEGSGKTSLMFSALANLQRVGGKGIFLDFEHAISHEYAAKAGVDFSGANRLLQPHTLEQGLQIIALGIRAGVDLIVVDSLSAMTPQAELDKPLTDPARVGALASAMSTNIPKLVHFLHQWKPEGHPGTALVFLNQKRAKISTGPSYSGPQETTSGGKAPKFYFSLRLDLARITSESIEAIDRMTGKKKKYQVGNVVGAKIVKTKVAPNLGASSNFFIRYGSGVDEAYSIMAAAEVNGLIQRAGGTYTFKEEKYGGKEKLRQYLVGSPEILASLKEATIKALLDNAPKVLDTSDDDDLDVINQAFGIGGTDEDLADKVPEEITESED